MLCNRTPERQTQTPAPVQVVQWLFLGHRYNPLWADLTCVPTGITREAAGMGDPPQKEKNRTLGEPPAA